MLGASQRQHRNSILRPAGPPMIAMSSVRVRLSVRPNRVFTNTNFLSLADRPEINEADSGGRRRDVACKTLAGRKL